MSESRSESESGAAALEMPHTSEGGPAFPCQWFSITAGATISFPGMSYRQWLIGQALAGLAAAPDLGFEDMSSGAIELADMTLVKLEAENG